MATPSISEVPLTPSTGMQLDAYSLGTFPVLVENSKLTYAIATKGKKTKRKKPGGKSKINGITENANGTNNEVIDAANESEHDEPETPIEEVHPQGYEGKPSQNGDKSALANGTLSKSIDIPQTKYIADEEDPPLSSPATNRSRKTTLIAQSQEEPTATEDHGDTESRLDTLVKDRARLREEVAELRRSLEEIQIKHEAEVGHIRQQLEDTRGGKDHAEAQYQTLLSKVNTIRSQLGERLKADAVSI